MIDDHSPLLKLERIKFIKKTKSKKCAFDTLTELFSKSIPKTSKHEIFDALSAREKLGNTSIGNGIAVPRAYLDIPKPIAALLVLKKGIDLNAADKVDIKHFLAVLIPISKSKKYSNFIKNINKNLVSNKAFTEKALSKNTHYDEPIILMRLFETLFTNNEVDSLNGE